MADEIIILSEKHGDRYLKVEPNKEAVALEILRERVADGYWYENWGDDPQNQWETDAQNIIDIDDGVAAWEFLQERSDHEYEGIYIQRLE
jgi:hypothetical protein